MSESGNAQSNSGQLDRGQEPPGKDRLHQIGEVLVQTARDTFADDVPQWAAAIAYYSLLSAFPLLLAAVSISAYFVDPNWATQQFLRLLGEFLPQGESFVRNVIEQVMNARGAASIVSILLLLWTGSRVFGVLTRALNIAYDVDESYGFGKRLLVEVGMMLTLGLVLMLALASDFVLNILWQIIQILPVQQSLAVRAVKWIVPSLLLFGAFFLIYRFVPRGRRHTNSALVGAAAATLLFLVTRPVFFTYIQQFAGYNLVYGPIAAVIVLMVWAWLVALILLFGGELASHVQMMMFQGESADEVGQRHEERSPNRKRRSADHEHDDEKRAGENGASEDGTHENGGSRRHERQSPEPKEAGH